MMSGKGKEKANIDEFSKIHGDEMFLPLLLIDTMIL